MGAYHMLEIQLLPQLCFDSSVRLMETSILDLNNCGAAFELTVRMCAVTRHRRLSIFRLAEAGLTGLSVNNIECLRFRCTAMLVVFPAL